MGRYGGNAILVSHKFNERSVVTQLSNVEPNSSGGGAETIIGYLSQKWYGKGIVQLTITGVAVNWWKSMS